MKQLQPTSIDEYIAEHKEGDLVTGRVADVSGGKAKVELGEGVLELDFFRGAGQRRGGDRRADGEHGQGDSQRT